MFSPGQRIIGGTYKHISDRKILAFGPKVVYTTLVEHTSGCGAVDSALGLGPRGRRFESFHPDQLKFTNRVQRALFLLC